jgi:hypothetical protein
MSSKEASVKITVLGGIVNQLLLHHFHLQRNNKCLCVADFVSNNKTESDESDENHHSLPLSWRKKIVVVVVVFLIVLVSRFHFVVGRSGCCVGSRCRRFVFLTILANADRLVAVVKMRSLATTCDARPRDADENEEEDRRHADGDGKLNLGAVERELRVDFRYELDRAVGVLDRRIRPALERFPVDLRTGRIARIGDHCAAEHLVPRDRHHQAVQRLQAEQPLPPCFWLLVQRNRCIVQNFLFFFKKRDGSGYENEHRSDSHVIP